VTSLEKQVKVKNQGRAIASVDGDKKRGPYVGEIMTRLNVSWAGQYFDFISEK